MRSMPVRVRRRAHAQQQRGDAAAHSMHRCVTPEHAQRVRIMYTKRVRRANMLHARACRNEQVPITPEHGSIRYHVPSARTLHTRACCKREHAWCD
eukprot:350747-Chlamydomonas_euryale.AAC.4